MKNIKNLSKKIRLESLFYTKKAGFGHLGGTFSCIEILINLYFSNEFNFHKKDFFILSKGHANLALLSILVEKKIIQQKVLDSYGKNFGIGGQLDINIKGIHWNTGSLGHSIGVSAGVALSYNIKKLNKFAVTLIGDSELDEGASWEAINFAGENKLNNLLVYVDRNRYSVTSNIDNSLFFKSPKRIMNAYGWDVFHADGHNLKDLLKTTKLAKKSKKPALIICETIKGKGVSFMENNKGWHHGAVNQKQYDEALKDIIISF